MLESWLHATTKQNSSTLLLPNQSQELALSQLKMKSIGSSWKIEEKVILIHFLTEEKLFSNPLVRKIDKFIIEFKINNQSTKTKFIYKKHLINLLQKASLKLVGYY